MPLASTPYAHGFFRVAACIHGVALADPCGNLAATLAPACAVDRQRTGLAVFPERVPADEQRGDWRAPSDASARVWLDELAAVRRP
jgi:hypothetical protein